MLKRNIPRKGIEDVHKRIAEVLRNRPRRRWIGPYPEDYEPTTEEWNDPKNWKSVGCDPDKYLGLMLDCLQIVSFELEHMLKLCDHGIYIDRHGEKELCDCPFYEDYKNDLGPARLGEEEAD